jgi:hypothetical protein
MASRKTYFGIGWPKDPADAVPSTPTAREPEERSAPTVIDDRSAPTVVDDEKVAEGLKQLRSWYQGDDTQDKNEADASAVPTPYAPQGSSPTASHARPTAVGHTSGSPPAMPRPIAPDPMRATMYGHDVHQFEFPPAPGDTTPAPQQPPPPQHQPPTPQQPPAASTALVVADPAVRSREMMYRQQADAQGAAVRSTQMPFQLAGHGEAQRLVRPGGQKPTPYPPPSSVARVPLTSKLVFAGGIAAFTGAVLIWLLSGNEPEIASAPPPPPPATMVQTPPPPAPIRVPTATPTPTATPARAPTPAAPAAVQPPALPPRTAIAPARPIVSPSLRAPGAAPEPIPLVTEPKTERPTRPRRQKAVEVEKPAADEEAAATAVATSPQTDKEPPATDAKELKEAKDTKEVKAVKEQKETKAAKESKSRSGDPDAPLPPSSLD